MGNKSQNIIFLWLTWHFYEMPKFLLQVWSNYFMFASNYFSLGLLLKTFFSPWRKYRWRYPRGLVLGEFFSTLISNSFSRILGAMMRVVLIILGILFQIFIALAGLVVFVAWILTPVIIVIGFLFVFSIK